MSLAILRSPESVRDVEGIVQLIIDNHRPATAIKFGKAVQRTLDLLAALPEIGTLWESREARLLDVRFQKVRGFKRYLVFYRLTDAGLHVMRVVDGRRNLEELL